MLEQTPKKRAVHNALFERELLQWNTLIKMKIHDTNNIDFPNISSMKMLSWIVLILFPELCITFLTIDRMYSFIIWQAGKNKPRQEKPSDSG